jgi:hypothetical protein
VRGAQPFAQLDARHLVHRDVGDDEVARDGAQQLEPARRRRPRVHVEAALAQSVLHELCGVLVVVDHENRGGHQVDTIARPRANAE